MEAGTSGVEAAAGGSGLEATKGRGNKRTKGPEAEARATDARQMLRERKREKERERKREREREGIDKFRSGAEVREPCPTGLICGAFIHGAVMVHSFF